MNNFHMKISRFTVSIDNRRGALQGQIISLLKKSKHEFIYSITQYFKESRASEY